MLALFFFLLSQSGYAVHLNESALGGAWLETDAKWVSVPKDVAPNEQWAQAAVFYFGKDHKFSLIYCTVIRVPERYMNISNGDPRGVYTGQWSVHEDRISVTYQLVEQTILLKDQKLPGPMQSATIKISGGPILNFDGKRFRRAVALDESASH